MMLGDELQRRGMIHEGERLPAELRREGDRDGVERLLMRKESGVIRMLIMIVEHERVMMLARGLLSRQGQHECMEPADAEIRRGGEIKCHERIRRAIIRSAISRGRRAGIRRKLHPQAARRRRRDEDRPRCACRGGNRGRSRAGRRRWGRRGSRAGEAIRGRGPDTERSTVAGRFRQSEHPPLVDLSRERCFERTRFRGKRGLSKRRKRGGGNGLGREHPVPAARHRGRDGGRYAAPHVAAASREQKRETDGE